MLQVIKKENLKSVNLKYAKYCHILKNEIRIFCEKKDKQGVKTEFFYSCKNEIPIRLQSGKKFNAAYIYLNENYIKAIKDIIAIEFWPNNEGYEADYNLKSMIIRTKKMNISLNVYLINGKKYGGHDHSVITDNENLLFS